MCGRYAASRAPEDLVGLFDVERWEPGETLAPDWNVAPTKPVHAVLERALKGEEADGSGRPVRQLRALTWGLVPSWAKSPDLGVKMINARAETVHEKPAYRRAFTARRCLLPADGYYEWEQRPASEGEEAPKGGKRAKKQPYFVTPADGSVMAMAGLYEFWRDPTLPPDHPQSWRVTCTVLTTAAETAPFVGADGGAGPRSLADIHPRMPLALPADRWDAWLDPGHTEGESLRGLLAPPQEGGMRAYPVSMRVSNARNNGPDLVTEADAAGGTEQPQSEGTLF